MRRFIFLLMLLSTGFAFAQERTVEQPVAAGAPNNPLGQPSAQKVQPILIVPAPSPTVHERVDVGLMISSVSASSIALGLTLSCTASQDCRELNPVMRKLLGDGPVRAAVVKSTANGAITYLAWRTTRGWTRTALLGALAAINVLDAAHDIRQMRQIERRNAVTR